AHPTRRLHPHRVADRRRDHQHPRGDRAPEVQQHQGQGEPERDAQRPAQHRGRPGGVRVREQPVRERGRAQLRLLARRALGGRRHDHRHRVGVVRQGDARPGVPADVRPLHGHRAPRRPGDHRGDHRLQL
ncbi:MAG: hypothetical protein AVDCRST_MAG11-1909, partial [uncultured Gemmatimonadaceae bacterium]